MAAIVTAAEQYTLHFADGENRSKYVERHETCINAYSESLADK